MTPLQKLQVRQSELRQRTNELLEKDTLTAEESKEMDQAVRELQEIEPKLRAAVVAQATADEAAAAETDAEGEQQRDDEPDAEERELRELSSRAQLSGFVAAAMSQRAVDGAESEFAQALQTPVGDGHVPLVMLLDEKERADAATDFSAADVPQTPGRFLARVFQEMAARWLGITFESVPVGERVHTVLTGGVDPDTVARAAAHDADAATISTQIMSPNRLTARYLFAVEDVARLPQLEARLRQDLSAAMGDQMDDQIFNGNTQLTTSGGLSAGLAAGQTETVAAFAAATADNLHQDVLSAIDGVYAPMLENVRLVMDSDPYKQIKRKANSEVQMFLYDILKAQGLAMRSSNHVAGGALAAGDKWAYASRSRGLAGAAVAAVWPSMQLIRDPYTAAAKGQVALTVIQLWDFALIRADNFRRFVATAK